MSFHQEIFKQLGGNRFIAMTGAKDFVYSDKDKTLSFKLPKRSGNKVNFVKIKLTTADLYDIEFSNIAPMTAKNNYTPKVTVLKAHSGVYNDMLQSLFTDATGLYTKL